MNDQGFYDNFCPWCEEEQKIEVKNEKKFFIFECFSCDRPVIVIDCSSFQLNEDLLISMSSDFLKKNINLFVSFFDEIFLKKLLDSKSPINSGDVDNMKDFLKTHKVSRDGKMF
ncbi:hypothetical protein AB834_05280 [PVC group bacterium (ex Bugula neritina AB1)]|nr:hypothetical protein AB834_05280 [PVC group bacterium (ex Bugula neritina AB1)]